jgi:hypothetical protein
MIEMAQVYKLSPMEASTKANSKTTRFKAKVASNIQTVTLFKASGKTIKLKVLVSTLTEMEPSIKATGTTTNKTVKV